MIVEEQGIDFRTGVRFPSGPFMERPGKTAFMRLSGNFFTFFIQCVVNLLASAMGI